MERTASNIDSDPASSSANTNTAYEKRRDQVRKAQRTHRARRAKYLETLEKEAEALRVRNAWITTELTRQKIVNDRLCVLLHANNIRIPPEVLVVDDSAFCTTIQVVGAIDGFQSLQLSSTKPQVSIIESDYLVPEDWARLGVAFVLALEQVCLRDHHNNIGADGEVGHAMQLQATLLDYAPPTFAVETGKVLPAGAEWNMPIQELEKQLDSLMTTAQKLALDDEMVPIMCWKAVWEWHQRRAISYKELEELQKVLSGEVICYGFGAVIDISEFQDICRKVLGAAH